MRAERGVMPVSDRGRRRIAAVLLAGSCLGSIHGAWAQTAPEPGPIEAVHATDDVNAVAADEADVVLVTARRREEDPQDVPIALSVVGAETLGCRLIMAKP